MTFRVSSTHQVRSTNANVHNISDGFTTEAFPLSTTHSLQKRTDTLTQLAFVLYAKRVKWKITHMAENLHLLQDSVHLRHDIFPIHQDRGVSAVPQGNMKDSSALLTYTTKD